MANHFQRPNLPSLHRTECMRRMGFSSQWSSPLRALRTTRVSGRSATILDGTTLTKVSPGRPERLSP